MSLRKHRVPIGTTNLPGYDDWLTQGYDECDPDRCPNCGDEDCEGCDGEPTCPSCKRYRGGGDPCTCDVEVSE